MGVKTNPLWTRLRRNYWILALMLLFAWGIQSFFDAGGTVTGYNARDGVIIILAGLYICTHPAANLLEMLFAGRYGPHQETPWYSSLFWLALNTLVLVAGFVILLLGTTRLYM